MTGFKSPYAGYDVLAKWDTPSWDDQTREVIRRRLTEIPGRRFFTEPEWRTLAAGITTCPRCARHGGLASRASTTKRAVQAAIFNRSPLPIRTLSSPPSSAVT